MKKNEEEKIELTPEQQTILTKDDWKDKDKYENIRKTQGKKCVGILQNSLMKINY